MAICIHIFVSKIHSKKSLFLLQMSLNNASKSQKTHRERHQPEARNKLGLLEKKKDYQLRAKDYNEKKTVLKELRKKALNKNPDEFYFHMVNSKLEDGVHHDKLSKKDKNALSQEQIKLMQTQDYKYVSSRRVMEQKKIEKLKATLHLLDSSDRPKNTHTIFVDDEKEKRSLDLSEMFDTESELLGRTFNRIKKSHLSSSDVVSKCEMDEDQLKSQYKSYKQLSQRIQRAKQLAIVEQKIKIKRHLMNKKEKPATVLKEETPDSAPVVVWQAERKR